jgi:hypothetical protein
LKSSQANHMKFSLDRFAQKPYGADLLENDTFQIALPFDKKISYRKIRKRLVDGAIDLGYELNLNRALGQLNHRS